MEFWNLLSFVEDEQLVQAAQFCEEIGFDAVGVSDHLFMPEKIESRYPMTEDGKPFFTIESKWSFPDGRRTTLDEKKKLWEDFAEKVIRHFPRT